MSEAPGSPIPLENTLDGTLGFETLELSDERAVMRAEVQDRHKQPFGLVHGGVYAALAESLASQATYAAVASDGKIAVGQSNHTSFLRPILAGYVNAEGHRRHRGATTWIWDVDITDDSGRLCATSRVTMAVRPRPGGPR